jgi:TolB-like protein
LSVFLTEMKRRKVYRVAVVYVVVGSGIIGLGDAALPFWDRLQVPVVVLILAGLPIALVLAWAYEIKPEAPRPAETPSGILPSTPAAGDPAPPTPSDDRKSIVVLPFDNMSPDPGDAYLSDGLTEELIAELSGIRNLRVISRTTAMKLKDSGKDITAIAQELNVQYVLEGSVRKAGDDLRITAQLIDARSDDHLGAERYSGTMDDVFEMQESLARNIVEALKVSLSPEEQRLLSKPRITNPLAFECYLRARQYVAQFTAEGEDRAIELLEKALEIEGPNELLYTTMGFAYTNYSFGAKSEDLIREEAERWAAQALEVNPRSNGARVLQGITLFHQGRTQESVLKMKEVLRSDPDNESALFWCGGIAGWSGHIQASRSYYERLAAVDPMTGGVNPSWFAFYSGDFDQAVEGYRAEWELDPESPYARWSHGHTLAVAGHIEEACEVLTSIMEDNPDTWFALLARFLVAALREDRAGVRGAMTSEFEAGAKRDMQTAWIVASGYAKLGIVDEAVAWLREAMNRGFIHYPFLAEYEPFLARVRSDPRVQEVLSEVRRRWEAFEP